MQLTSPLVLTPEYRAYVWGGERLRPGQRTAEMWAIHEDNRVAQGPLAGLTLTEIALKEPVALMGERAFQRTGRRFPLLIKVLDCAEWLSLQVHPDDELAEKLEGPGNFGKTEAWHILEAQPGAQLIAGLKRGTTAQMLADAIRNGTILERANTILARRGDTVFMPARTIHALGPGLLIYEVQQTSDVTYRVFDWNRPALPGRVLHIDKSLAVADATAFATAVPAPRLDDGGRATLVTCRYFTLEMLLAETRSVELNTEGLTFHALTVIEGEAEIVTSAEAGTGESVLLRQYASAVIPAACGPYALRPRGRTKVLKASIEG